jgi:hypothetical protein
VSPDERQAFLVADLLQSRFLSEFNKIRFMVELVCSIRKLLRIISSNSIRYKASPFFFVQISRPELLQLDSKSSSNKM